MENTIIQSNDWAYYCPSTSEVTLEDMGKIIYLIAKK